MTSSWESVMESGGPTGRSLLIEIDRHHATARPQRFDELGVVRCPILDMVQHVAEEDEIDSLRCQTYIR